MNIKRSYKPNTTYRVTRQPRQHNKASFASLFLWKKRVSLGAKNQEYYLSSPVAWRSHFLPLESFSSLFSSYFSQLPSLPPLKGRELRGGAIRKRPGAKQQWSTWLAGRWWFLKLCNCVRFFFEAWRKENRESCGNQCWQPNDKNVKLD